MLFLSSTLWLAGTACREHTPAPRSEVRGGHPALDQEPPPRAPSESSARKRRETLSVATFNTGLSPTVAKRAERAGYLVESLRSLDADVVCLQELWSERDRARLQALEPEYTVTVGKAESERQSLRCSTREATLIDSCLGTHCAGSDDLPRCALARCRSVVTHLSPSCAGCISQHAEDSTWGDALRSCRTGRVGSGHAYDGALGLVMLTRQRPLRIRTEALPSGRVARGLLHVALSDGIDVFCTHLSAPGEALGGTTQRDLQRGQIDAIVGRIRQSGSTPAVLLGDFNATLRDSLLVPLLDLGFSAPYLQGDGRCTYCSAGGGSIIDHIFLEEPLRGARPMRIFDEPLPAIGMTLSDHFGVLLMVEPREQSG